MNDHNMILPLTFVLFFKKGKIFLGLRQNTRTMNGHWSMPAGHVEKGESPLDGAIREAKEEVGVTLKPEDLKLVVTAYRKAEHDDFQIAEYIFVAEKWDGEIVNAEPDKCVRLEWFDIRSLPEPMIPSQARYIKAYLNGENYVDYGFDKPLP